MENEAVGVRPRGRVPRWGHLAEPPPMCPQRVAADQPLECPMPERVAKLALPEEANSHGSPLEAGAGPPRVKARGANNAS